MDKLYFVTGNKNKVKEVQVVFDHPIEIVDLDLDEIQSLDINEVVKKKAEAAYLQVKKPLIVEDVGMYVKAWNGFPGPLVKFLHKAGGDSFDLLLRMLENETDKTVCVMAVIGYHDSAKVNLIEGSFNGKFVEKKGEMGWGFDPYIIPDGYDKTFGELSEDIKNLISHRSNAFKKLKKFLDSQEK